MRKSLKTKFVISICWLTLAVLIVTLSLALVLAILLFRNSSETALEQAALLGRQEVGLWLREREEWLLDFQEDIGQFEMGDQEGIERHMASHHSEYIGLEQVFIGTVDNEFYSSVYWRPEEGYDCRVRDWYVRTRERGSTTYITYHDGTTGEMVLSLCVPVTDKNGTDMGVLGIDIKLDTLIAFVDQSNIMNTSGKAFLLDGDQNFVTHPNPEYCPRTMANGGEAYTSFAQSEIQVGHNISSKDIFLGKGRDWDGTKAYISTSTVEGIGWTYGFAVPLSDFYTMYYKLVGGFSIIIVVMVLVSVFCSSKISKRLLVPIQTIIGAANRMANGDVEQKVEIRTGDELEELAKQFRRMAGSTSRQIEIMKDMAEGNFSGRIEPKSDFDVLSKTINDVNEQLHSLVTNVKQCAAQVADGSLQMADTATSLAQGTVQQAASVEELFASQENILKSIQKSADLAREANATVLSVRDEANRGTLSMDEMVHAVQEIEQAAGDITNIIQVIEDIAFQTNILALNAAVEAARAGQYGKGFAVVADEVRSLALHSSKAAQETSSLVETTSHKAGGGVEIARRAQDAYREIVSSIDTTVNMVKEIDEITDLQVLDMEQISENVSQISNVVQQNSATAEESAATSEEMSSQAQVLKSMVDTFQTHRAVMGGKQGPYGVGGTHAAGHKPDEQKMQLDYSNWNAQ